MSIRYTLKNTTQQEIQYLTNPLTQEQLYHTIMNDVVCTHYPPSQQLCIDFYDDYIQFLHSNNVELINQWQQIEETVKQYKSSLTSNHGDVYYKTLTYTIDSIDYTISSYTAVAQSTLIGQAIWPAALLANTYITHNINEFTKKRVLELGAGTGVTSCLLHLCSASHLIVTDYLDSVLNVCDINFRNNFANLCRCRGNCQCTYSVNKFDWTELNTELINGMNIDIIICADCCYIPEDLNMFANTVKHCLNSSHHDAYALLIQKERNPLTFMSYLSELRECGLHIEEIDTTSLIPYIDADTDVVSDVYIHKATLKRT